MNRENIELIASVDSSTLVLLLTRVRNFVQCTENTFASQLKQSEIEQEMKQHLNCVRSMLQNFSLESHSSVVKCHWNYFSDARFVYVCKSVVQFPIVLTMEMPTVCVWMRCANNRKISIDLFRKLLCVWASEDSQQKNKCLPYVCAIFESSQWISNTFWWVVIIRQEKRPQTPYLHSTHIHRAWQHCGKEKIFFLFSRIACERASEWMCVCLFATIHLSPFVFRSCTQFTHTHSYIDRKYSQTMWFYVWEFSKVA